MSIQKIFTYLGLWMVLLRLHRPMGGLYLFIPCLWGYVLSHGDGFVLSQGLLLFLASFWARGLGCAFNDWVDQGVDEKVSRTACRPFPQKKLTTLSFIGGFLFFASTGTLILSIFLPLKVFLWGFLWGILVVLYPFCKRWTHYPQVVLGLCFNGGVFLGTLGKFPPFSATSSDVWWVFALVYGWGISWTLDYDTVYSFQDRAQDKEVGVLSLGLKVQSVEGPFLTLCKLSRWLISMALLGVLPMKYPEYYATLSTMGTLLSFFHQSKLNVQDPSSCHRYFTRHILWEGLFFTLGLWLSGVTLRVDPIE